MTKPPAMPEPIKTAVSKLKSAQMCNPNAVQHLIEEALAALQSAQPAAAVSDDDILTASHRLAWRYKHSSDPAHSSTYTFNRACLLQFARAILALRPQAVPIPEPVQRLLRYAGQTMRTARNPNITARDAIAIGDYLAAIGITQRADGGEG